MGARIGYVIYELGALATWVKLMFFDGYSYTWWNWIVAFVANTFLAGMWPLYWLFIRPFFH